MKALKPYIPDKTYFFTIIALFNLFFASCRSVRSVAENEALVTRVSLKGIDPSLREAANQYVQPDIRHNSRINLFIYNLANGKKGRYRKDKIRKVGEAPNLLDSSLVELSRVQMERFLQTKGYFNAHVNSSIVQERKRAHITFHAAPGPSFKIRRINRMISDPLLANFYDSWHQKHSYLHEGDHYDAGLLAAEREYIYQSAKESGYFDFLRQNVRFEIDTSLHVAQADVTLFIGNMLSNGAFTRYTVDSSLIEIREDQARSDRQPAAVCLACST